MRLVAYSHADTEDALASVADRGTPRFSSHAARRDQAWDVFYAVEADPVDPVRMAVRRNLWVRP